MKNRMDWKAAHKSILSGKSVRYFEWEKTSLVGVSGIKCDGTPFNFILKVFNQTGSETRIEIFPGMGGENGSSGILEKEKGWIVIEESETGISK